jgi:hypothetical protein
MCLIEPRLQAESVIKEASMSPSPSNPESSLPSKSRKISVPNVTTPTPSIPDKERDPSSTTARDAAAGARSWTVPALRAAYLWPGDLAGGVIAIVELGGDQALSHNDSFFQSIKEPSQQIADVSADGTQNRPNQSAGLQDIPCYEVVVDIEIAGAVYLPGHGRKGRD